MNGSLLQTATEVKYLGVTIDHKLKWKEYLKSTQRKAATIFIYGKKHMGSLF